jgi:hypothetical protein
MRVELRRGILPFVFHSTDNVFGLGSHHRVQVDGSVKIVDIGEVK